MPLEVPSFRGHPLRQPSIVAGKRPSSSGQRPSLSALDGFSSPGPSGDEHDPETWTKLISGIESGDLEAVRAAIKSQKVDINALDEVR